MHETTVNGPTTILMEAPDGTNGVSLDTPDGIALLRIRGQDARQRPSLPEAEALLPPEIPPSWKTIGSIDFIGRRGETIPKYEFCPQSLLILPNKGAHDDSNDVDLETLVNFLQDGWKLGEPRLLVNVIGDVEHSHVSGQFRVQGVEFGSIIIFF